jgi:nitrate/nitrite transporter NarK
MTDALTGRDVVAVAADSSLPNTEAALVAGSVVGIVGALGSILVIGGYIDASQSKALQDSAGQIVPALFVIAAIVQAVWTRMKVYSARSAARVAVANAAAPAGTPPSLAPPP